MGRQTKKQRQRKQQTNKPTPSKLVVSSDGKTEKRATIKRVMAGEKTVTETSTDGGATWQPAESNITDTYRRAREAGAIPDRRDAKRSKARPLAPGEQTMMDMARKALQGERPTGSTTEEPPRPTRAQFDGALDRLKVLAEVMQAKPKPILQQLAELGVTINIVQNVPGDSRYDTVVLKVTEIQQADQRLAEQGSINEQLYRRMENGQ